MKADKEEAFYKHTVIPRREETHALLEEDFQAHKDEWAELFVSSVKGVAGLIGRSGPPKAGFLVYCLLRTDILAKKYVYRIHLYDSAYILRPETVLGEFDVSHIYKHYDRMEAQLKREYMGYITIAEPEVETILLDELGLFQKYAVETMRLGLLDLLETGEYKGIPKEDRFEIHCGEYFEPCYIIHSEIKNKDYDELIKRLERREKDAYAERDFTGLQYEDGDMQNLDLRYADFRNGNLCRTDLSLGLLIGAKFKGCLMEGAMLTASDISDANFEGAKMAGANFTCVVSLLGKPTGSEWKAVGFTGTNFKNSDLRDADFRGAVLIGADFRGASLKGADFSDAEIYRSVIDTKAFEEADFTEAQRSGMTVREGGEHGYTR
jgi:uncharacterized protein YjbI with pentapeptide repeats